MYAETVTRIRSRTGAVDGVWEQVYNRGGVPVSTLPEGMTRQFGVRHGDPRYGHVLICEDVKQADAACQAINRAFVLGKHEIKNQIADLLGVCQKEER